MATLHSVSLRYLVTLGVEVQRNTDGDTRSTAEHVA